MVTTYGAPYSSKSTGKVERSNKRIDNALRAVLPDSRIHKWDIYLPSVVYALNGLKSKHTGYSSNFLVFGQELNMPFDLLINAADPIEHKSKAQRAYKLYRDVKHTLLKVRENALLDYGYTATYYNKSAKGNFFEPGDYVYVLINCPSHKFGPRWIGPKKILRVLNEGHTYVVDWNINKVAEKVVSFVKLKRYVRNKYSNRILEPEIESKDPIEIESDDEFIKIPIISGGKGRDSGPPSQSIKSEPQSPVPNQLCTPVPASDEQTPGPSDVQLRLISVPSSTDKVVRPHFGPIDPPRNSIVTSPNEEFHDAIESPSEPTPVKTRYGRTSKPVNRLGTGQRRLT